MSILSGLFGSKKMPTPTPPLPRIGDAASEAAARESASRARKRFGSDDTILTGSLGTSTGRTASVQRATLLGGAR